jgi:lysophospholipase L1-like esterase
MMKTIFTYFSIIAIIMTIACSEKTNSQVKDGQENFNYLALGDSYTIGESVDTSYRFPMQLADSLVKYGNLNLSVDIIARTGWTTSELSEGINEENPNKDYDLVSLLIGVNNQYRGLDTGAYRQEFSVLLERAIQFAKGQPGQVIVLSIPDWGVTPFGINSGREFISEEIDQFNEINFQVSSLYKVHYIEVTSISRMAAEDEDLIANDGLHPSGKMYSRWVEKMIPVVLDILN